MPITIPDNEVSRLEALLRYNILDTEKDDVYDLICKLAASIMETPYAFITFIDADRAWAKATYGIEMQESSREYSFCSHAILTPNEPMVIKDATLDERFARNPYVTSDPNIRFYFGCPLVTSNQEAIGTICTVDSIARKAPTPFQMEALSALAKLIMSQLDVRAHMINIHKEVQQIKLYPVTAEAGADFADTYKKLTENCDSILEKIKARRAAKDSK